MFKRRIPLTVLQTIRELFWPSMGWMRAFTYTKHRIVRLSDTSHKIALGLALGAAISFTPIIGTHFIQAGFIAVLIRANFLAALIGTFCGNPWTFPFMWYSAMQFGTTLFGLLGLPAEAALPDEMSFSIMWDLISHEPLRVFMPWALGGYLLGLLSMPFTYFVFLNLVRGAKMARSRAKLSKARKEGRNITGQVE